MLDEPLRIAHVAPVILPVPPHSYGGTERVIADLASEQIAQGHRVTLFAGRGSNVSGATRIGSFDPLSVHDSRSTAAGTTLPPGFPAVLEAIQLDELLRHEERLDIIHLHGPAQTSAAARALNVPHVRTVHWRADEADIALLCEAFPDERLIAISEAQARDLPKSNLAGIVHHGLPLDRYLPGRGDGGYLAFLGRMTDQKRPDRAIEIARSANMPLRLAGPVDPGNPGYFAAHVEPALDRDVTYVGSIGDSEKTEFLGNAAALLFPIDWPEPFGLVMIEAMAMGTPVIAWSNGAAPEIIEDGVTGFLVETNDEAIRAVERLHTLDRQRIRHRFEERFSAVRMADAYLSIYCTLT